MPVFEESLWNISSCDFISESLLSTHISLFASLLWKRTWFVVQSTSSKMFTSELRFNKLADLAKKDLSVSKLGESPQKLFIIIVIIIQNDRTMSRIFLAT